MKTRGGAVQFSLNMSKAVLQFGQFSSSNSPTLSLFASFMVDLNVWKWIISFLSLNTVCGLLQNAIQLPPFCLFTFADRISLIAY